MKIYNVHLYYFTHHYSKRTNCCILLLPWVIQQKYTLFLPHFNQFPFSPLQQIVFPLTQMTSELMICLCQMLRGWDPVFLEDCQDDLQGDHLRSQNVRIQTSVLLKVFSSEKMMEWWMTWNLNTCIYRVFDKNRKKAFAWFCIKIWVYQDINKRYKNNCHIYPFAIISIHKLFIFILKVHRGS